jgi:hypothetical protein
MTSGWVAGLRDLSELSPVHKGVALVAHFIAKEVDGLGEKGSVFTAVVDIQALFETYLNMSLRSACCIDEAFFCL